MKACSIIFQKGLYLVYDGSSYVYSPEIRELLENKNIIKYSLSNLPGKNVINLHHFLEPKVKSKFQYMLIKRFPSEQEKLEYTAKKMLEYPDKSDKTYNGTRYQYLIKNSQ